MWLCTVMAAARPTSATFAIAPSCGDTRLAGSKAASAKCELLYSCRGGGEGTRDGRTGRKQVQMLPRAAGGSPCPVDQSALPLAAVLRSFLCDRGAPRPTRTAAGFAGGLLAVQPSCRRRRAPYTAIPKGSTVYMNSRRTFCQAGPALSAKISLFMVVPLVLPIGGATGQADARVGRLNLGF